MAVHDYFKIITEKGTLENEDCVKSVMIK